MIKSVRRIANLLLLLLPRPFHYSYKLWYNYLRERRKQVKGKCVTDPSYEEINNCHERALVFMHKVKLLSSTVFNKLFADLLSKIEIKSAFVFFWTTRCPDYGLTTASSLYLKARSQEAGKHLTVRFELSLSPSIRASGLCTFALPVICHCLRQPFGCTAGTLR